jgi:HlyD family secretion protein
MNRRTGILLGSIVLVVLLAGWWWRSHAHAAAPKYRTASVERGDITSTVSATGTVAPVLQVQVGSQVSGTLAKLSADFNSHVKSGQVLAQLETSAFVARLAQAEAAVAKADAAVRDGQRQLTRSQELVKGDYISQADLDASKLQLEQRQADLKQARATLQSAQVDLDHTTIRSPIDGVVISRSVDVGQTVAASLQAPQLFVIANDLKNMQVETKIDEADIGRIKPGLPVQFTVDAFPDVNFSGTVSQVRLEPITESNVVTYTTVIATRNDDLRLKPGMTANVTVLVETRQNVLKVPNAALRFRPDGAGSGGGRGGMGGGGSAGGAGGGFRRTFAALLSKLAPNAYAQGTPPQGAPPQGSPPTGGRGGLPGANDPFVQQVRERVQKGELTREQAHELIRKHLESLGLPQPGGPGGLGTPPPGAGGGAGAKGAHGARGMRDSSSVRARAARGDSTGWGVRGGWGGGGFADASEVPGGYKQGAVYLLNGQKPQKVKLLSGITDGTMTEIRSDQLKEGDLVVTGVEVAAAKGSNLTPPPGMGGPQFRGPRGGGGGGGRVGR